MYIHITYCIFHSVSILASAAKVGAVINDTTCQYDGMVGNVQRNESDTFSNWVRPDSTPCEPGYFLTFCEIDDSPKIFSVRKESIEVDVQDILYLWTNFGIDIWMYFLISITLCAAMLMMLSSSDIHLKSIEIFFDSFWNYFMLFVDQAATIFLPLPSALVLWSCICTAFFYAIHLVLLGTLSTDLTVPIRLRSIESLQNLLYDEEFNHTQPVIFRQLNKYSMLKNSRHGTDERVLFEKIIANNTVGVREFPLKKPQSLLTSFFGLVGKAIAGEIAIIENSEIFLMALIYGLCYFDPDLIGKITPAKDTISQSVMSMLMSKKTPSSLRKFAEYRLLASGEAALMKGSAKTLGKSMLESAANIPLSTKGFICGERFEHTFKEEMDLPWQPLTMDPFKRMIRICLGFFLLGFIILIFEKVHKHSKGRKRNVRKNIRKVTTYRMKDTAILGTKNTEFKRPVRSRKLVCPD